MANATINQTSHEAQDELKKKTQNKTTPLCQYLRNQLNRIFLVSD